MILPAAPRRPSRASAIALLAALHVAAIWSFLQLGTTRERADERLVQLILLALDEPAPPRQPEIARPSQPPRPLVAPLPPVVVEAPPTAAAAAAPAAPAAPSGGAGDGAAAVAPPGPAKLDLTIPKDFYAHPPPLTPAQEAMRDPRSNHLELTKQEKLDIAFGVIECVAWQREPDGSIYRGPGHWARIQGISTNPFTRHKAGEEDRGRECVK